MTVHSLEPTCLPVKYVSCSHILPKRCPGSSSFQSIPARADSPVLRGTSPWTSNLDKARYGGVSGSGFWSWNPVGRVEPGYDWIEQGVPFLASVAGITTPGQFTS